MTSFILQILQHTPSWVWPLFAALLWLGYLQSRTRSMPLWRLSLLPLGFIGLSFFSTVSAFGLAPAALAAWGAGVALAVAAGRAFARPGGFAYSAATRQVTVPGSWLPLALIMTIFFTRYAVAVLLAITPALRRTDAFALGGALVYGFLSGLFLARALRARRAVRAQQ